MSAVSASIPAPPIVSISTMGGATGTGSNTVAVSAGGPRVGPIPGSSPIGSAGTPVGKCCENGRPVSTDPLTGQTICSCQYNPSALLMAASCYPRGVGVGMPGLSDAAAGVYSNPYATAAMQGLLPATAGADPTAFYSSMGLQGSGYYAYDPFSAYPYGNGFVMDPNARRKNATRESTQTLKAWLSEHRKNPYPTKGEKIMLAIITKMTLTQVSTWFANARRRLKKENKMTWSPRNRCGEDDDLDNDDLDDDKLNGDENDTNNNKDFDQSDDDGDVDIMNCPADRDSFVHSVDFRKACTLPLGPKGDDDINVLDDTEDEKDGKDRLGSAFTLVSPNRLPPGLNGHGIPSPTSDSERMRDSSCHKLTSPTTTTKPKIWSVADVVSKSNDESRTSDSEHSPTRSPIQHTPPHHLNGHHMPHPAFPTGAPPHMAARGMGLWNPSVVTSLAGMAAAGRYHPYSQALFSHPGAAGATTAASRAGPFSAMVPPGLLGSHQHHHTGALRQHVLGQQATDLRKISQLQSNNGRSSTGSPESKPMTSLGGRLPSSEGQGQRSRSASPTPATAFKPVARSN